MAIETVYYRHKTGGAWRYSAGLSFRNEPEAEECEVELKADRLDPPQLECFLKACGQ
jgi:hypothetical protein